MYRYLLILALGLVLTACADKQDTAGEADSGAVEAVGEVAGDCSQAKNVCPDYSTGWVESCSDGRCIEFRNSCENAVALNYQIGCNGDGTKGAPQCDCTAGPVLQKGKSVYWKVIDANYTSCLPSWQPPCLTAGLAVMANPETGSCTTGTRFEFTAGNQGDPYGKFDNYNLSTQQQWYAVPVHVKPDFDCANDTASHDCRPLWCNEMDCPDAYTSPTGGGCPDRSPQVGCQDTFNRSKGLLVEFCPKGCAKTGAECPSCEDMKPCG